MYMIRLNLSLLESKKEMTIFNLRYFLRFKDTGFSAKSYPKIAKNAFMGGFNPHFLKCYMCWITLGPRFVFGVRKSIEKT